MTGWFRPLAYVGLWVVPAGLLIVLNHPWVGAATFAAVLSGTLAHSRSRTRAESFVERDLPASATILDIADRVPQLSAIGGVRITAGGEERTLRAYDDQVVHFPPRRLPL